MEIIIARLLRRGNNAIGHAFPKLEMTKETMMRGSSLSELWQAGVERRLLQARAAALESLDDISETTRVLRERTYEIRSRLPQGQALILDRAQPCLPPTTPLHMAASR